jgi:GH24 family phage-related lysozyme (muramidase)
MRVSKKCVAFLASWEGVELKAYKVPGESFYTIGVGHARTLHGKKITANTRISHAEALELLHADLERFEEAVRHKVPYRWRRNRRHFETCVSLAFNMGEEILTDEPPLTSFGEVLTRPVSRRNARDAARAIQMYNKGGQPLRVMPGLTRRREAEAHLWLTGEYHNND